MSKTNNLPRDFFLYLFVTGSLYFIAITVIALLWQYVNYFFPDPALYQGGVSEGMRFAMAALIVVFPIYIWVMRFLSKDIDRNPEKKDLWVRRWLIYVTLFVAAVAIVVDLVTLVFQFLGGDLAIQFTLKAVAVLVVAVAVFAYYLYNLRRKPGTDQRKRKIIMWITIAVMLVLVVGAFFVVGSPATNRERKLDQERIYNLQSIQWQVLDYWQTREEIPEQLSDLENDFDYYNLPVDPETGAAYEYNVLGDLRFELCANFALSSDELQEPSYRELARPVGFGFKGLDSWEHEAGRTCFEREIDPVQFPPRSKQNVVAPRLID